MGVQEVVARGAVALPRGLADTLLADATRFFELDALPELTQLRTIRNPYSDVHIVEISRGDFRRRVYIKIPRSDFQGTAVLKARLTTEYEIMRTLSAAGPRDGTHGVAIPLGCYPEYPALATLEAGTRTLRMQYRAWARLLSLPGSRRALLAQVSDCGAWLRAFQERTFKENAPFDLDALRTYCGLRLDRLLAKQGFEFPIELAAGVRRAIDTEGPALHATPVRIVGRHNDFASHNILVDQGKIRLIDFSMFDYGPDAYDPCNFWLDIEVLKLDPSYAGKFLSALQAQFLEAYSGLSEDTPAFRLARCRYTLNRLVTSIDTARGWGPGAFYRRRVVRASMDWLREFATG